MMPNPSNPQSPVPDPFACYACLYRPPDHDDQRRAYVVSPLLAIAREFSPRYEQHRDDLVTIDVSGLGRLIGDARAIGAELRRETASRGVRVHVAIAGTRIAAMVLAHARPGLTLVEPGEEAEALAPLPIGLLEKAPAAMPAGASAQRDAHARHQRVGVGPREKVKNVDSPGGWTWGGTVNRRRRPC